MFKGAARISSGGALILSEIRSLVDRRYLSYPGSFVTAVPLVYTFAFLVSVAPFHFSYAFVSFAPATLRPSLK
jgi:uncharacterized membrane protein